MDAASNQSRPAPLDYSASPAWHRRRVARRLAWVFTGILLVVISWKLVPMMERRARAWYWQRLCLSYADPVGQIVLSENRNSPATPWSKFYSTLSPRSSLAVGTAFLHERVSPAGKRRLVVIEL